MAAAPSAAKLGPESGRGTMATPKATGPSSAGRQKRPAAGQEELRRLMREKQREAAGQGKQRKVDSPFAKYSRAGQLSCSLCHAPVKSELLWQTHVLGRRHKQKLAESKDRKPPVPGPVPNAASSLKRKVTDTQSPELKKGKGANDCPQTVPSGLPPNFFGKAEQGEAATVSRKDSSHDLLHGDNEEEQMEEDSAEELGGQSSSNPPLPTSVQNVGTPGPMQKPVTATLQSDYVDSSASAAPLVSHSGSIQKAEVQEKIVERKENTAEALPEGFFDDPEVDAKVRKVDAPKDQMDREWEEFQKAMRQVNTISEAIVAEEDEEGRLDRQIGEIDEQIECFRRVEQLRDRQDIMREKLKEALRLRAMQAGEDEELGSEEDEGGLQDLLSQDWRAKGTLL